MRVRPRGQIRSHRALRHKIIAPWIVVTLVTTFVVVGVSTGFYLLIRKPCSGDLSATVVAPPTTSTLLERAARSWAGQTPVVNGRCAAVNIEEKDSAGVAEALAQPTWNTKSGGTSPDGWVPESSLWVKRAGANPTVAKALPEKYDSLARTVPVIAMPRPMAEVMGWPNTDLTWTTLVTDLATTGWSKYKKPEWGSVRIMMADPTKSTTGLLALLDMSNPDDSGTPSQAGLDAIKRLKQVVPTPSANTDAILNSLSKADRQGTEGVYGLVSAFPALVAA